MSAQDVNCSVLRYNISLRKRNRRRQTDDVRPYVFEAELRLQRHGEFRNVDVARAGLTPRFPEALTLRSG